MKPKPVKTAGVGDRVRITYDKTVFYARVVEVHGTHIVTCGELFPTQRQVMALDAKCWESQ